MPDDDDVARPAHLGDLFAQLEQAQERIQSAAAEASATIVEGTAADGRVVVQLSGDLDAVKVHIDPTLVDVNDVPMLEDLLLAAIRDGLAQIAELQEDVAGAFGGGAGGLDLAGLLGNLGDLAGLGGLGDLGSLGGFDLGAIGQLPGLGALGGLAGGMGLSDAFGEDDDGDGGDDSSQLSEPERDGAATQSGDRIDGGVGAGGASYEGVDDDDAGPSGLG